MTTLELILPRLHSAQKEIVSQAGRFNVVSAGRRFGKNTLGEDRATHVLLEGLPVGWFSPTYKILADSWRHLVQMLLPVTKDKSEQEHRLELITGGVLEMWSLDTQLSGRSRGYRLAVVDEAALVPNLMALWNAALKPTLTDLAGDAWFFSTPQGFNDFWNLWRRGQDRLSWPEWRHFKYPSSANPHLPLSEIEAAQRELPSDIFRQEYLAEFVEGAGQLFRKVDQACTAEKQEMSQSGHVYTIGCDFAKQQDFTVFSVIDASMRQQVHVERMQRADYDVQIGRLEALCSRFRPDVVVVEETGNLALLDYVKKTGLPIRAFKTTNETKKAVVDRLALAFDREELTILPDPTQLRELQAFVAEKTPAGHYRYGAPEGGHDDTVMALAFAWSAAAAYPKIVQEPNWREDYDPGEPRDTYPAGTGFVEVRRR